MSDVVSSAGAGTCAMLAVECLGDGTGSSSSLVVVFAVLLAALVKPGIDIMYKRYFPRERGEDGKNG